MKVIDLTQYISENMPVYPGTEGPKIVQATTILREGFAEKLITMYSHTGTHMDAPGHIVTGAKTLDAFDAGHYIGTATLLDVSGCLDGAIDASLIDRHAESIRGMDFVLFRSGWSTRWGRESYFGKFPVLTEKAANLLCGLGLRGIGLDMISVDRVDTEDFPIHKILFRAGLVIVENLANLDAIDAPVFTFSCLPLKMPSSDGSPVRAVAMIGSAARTAK
ncbi:MAG: cyclase family protein [Rectinemataceae bacterium]